MPISRDLLTSKTDDWPTPRALFAMLHSEFDFTLDPCATAENAVCPLYFTAEQDGLAQDWGAHRVFCNPPYGRVVKAWARKCYESAQRGALVVLLAASRTDTEWFQDYVLGKADVYFIRGRLQFGDRKGARAPFPSLVAAYRPGAPARNKFCGG